MNKDEFTAMLKQKEQYDKYRDHIEAVAIGHGYWDRDAATELGKSIGLHPVKVYHIGRRAIKKYRNEKKY